MQKTSGYDPSRLTVRVEHAIYGVWASDGSNDDGRKCAPGGAMLHRCVQMSADLHSLLGPYSLDALGPIERARFETHLERCVLCQTELETFRKSVARLDDAEPPPRQLG